MTWTIVIPAWGDRCIAALRDFGLPAIKAALKLAKHPAEFRIYTDQPERLATALAGLVHTFLPINRAKEPHRMLGLVHIHALRHASRGEMLAFLNADHVPSVEAFAASEARFAQGKRLIMCAGLRTASDIGPPIGETARNLLAWEWANPHVQTSECVWGNGYCDQPAVLIFVNGNNVTLHAFHLHPFAVLKDERSLAFQGYTIDDDFPLCFKREEIHVVTDADEMALAEVSPPEPERWRMYESPMMIRQVVKWAHQKLKDGRPFVNRTHKWFFSQGICIVGDGLGDMSERERVAEILAAVG